MSEAAGEGRGPSPRLPAPLGVGAGAFDPLESGRGVAWADVEGGWRLRPDGAPWHDHLDHVAPPRLIGPNDPARSLHGTRVLGLILARPQLAAIYASGRRAASLQALRVPTLVIHGADDTLITPSGGLRTAELIDGAHLLMLSDMGHDLPPPLHPLLLDAICSHTRRADAHG